MDRLTRNGTAEHVSRDEIFRRERREISIFPVQLTTCRIGNLAQLIHTLAICVTIHVKYEVPCMVYLIDYVLRKLPIELCTSPPY